MVLQSKGSLKLEMLNLARTSKYVNNTSVLIINKTEEVIKDRKDSSNSSLSDLLRAVHTVEVVGRSLPGRSVANCASMYIICHQLMPRAAKR